MIKITVPLPKRITIACSGGVDSMAIVDFLKRKHDVTIAYFNHRTSHGEQASEFVAQYCTEHNIPMLYGSPRNMRGAKESMEEYWRNERYRFLSELGPVITCHHLDDCVETYIWSSLHGTPKVIPLVRNNVLRPFLTTRKSEFIRWCEQHNVPWIEDNSNKDTKYMRNYVRNELMPHALHVNPGLHTLVKKIVEGKQNS
jgi:tRNA(Ile)-lysidine synthetase-like protein